MSTRAEAFFSEIGLTSAQLDNLFVSNALRFVGLPSPSKASDRLRAFHRANNRPMPDFS
jgi:hypothetical protein